MLEITFQYTEDDLARGNRFIFSRFFRHKKFLLAYLLVFGVGMIVFAFAQPALDWRNTFVIIGVFSLLIFLSSFVLEPIVARLGARQIFKNNPHVRYPQTYKFEDENLTITGELFDASVKWHGVIEAAESDTDFLLFISNDQAYVLPKRVIDAGQESLLREFLKTKLQNRAKLN